VREARRLNRALKTEAARADAAARRVRTLVEPAPHSSSADGDNAGALAFLTTGPGAEQLGITPLAARDEDDDDAANAQDGAAPGPLATNASFALSQLPALRELLRRLRPRLEALGDGGGGTDGGGDAAEAPPADESAVARERRLYVEAQATRAVRRRLHGGPLDGDGDASGQGPGRGAVSLGELAALEALVEEFKRRDDDGDEAMDT
jgi:hypothetical protein